MPAPRRRSPAAFATGQVIAVSDKELWCLATAIYFEARGESYRGQVAVAQVVLNRVKDHRYPDTICGVVFQNQSRRNSCQFSFACDGIPETINDSKSWAQAAGHRPALHRRRALPDRSGRRDALPRHLCPAGLGAAHDQGHPDRAARVLQVQARLAVRLADAVAPARNAGDVVDSW